MAKERSLIEELERELGVFKLEKEPPKPVRTIATGFESFDHDILGIGGVPLGHVTQLYGATSGGKTLTAMRIIAMAQKQYSDKVPAYIDTEFTFDEGWAKKNGIDVKNLFYKRSNRLEEVFEYVIRLAESGKTSVIVLDSLGNLIIENSLDASEAYKKDKGGSYSYKEQPGVVAKKVTLFMRQLVELLYKNDIAFVVCNQIRYRIGVMYGDPTDFPGGENFRHNIAVNVQIRRIEDLEEFGKISGVTIGARVKKNKYFSLQSTDESNHLKFYFEDGIEKSRVYGVYDRAVRLGVIEQKGAWFKVLDGENEVEKIQGRDALIERVLHDEEFRQLIDKLCTGAEAAGVHVQPVVESTSSETSD